MERQDVGWRPLELETRNRAGPRSRRGEHDVGRRRGGEERRRGNRGSGQRQRLLQGRAVLLALRIRPVVVIARGRLRRVVRTVSVRARRFRMPRVRGVTGSVVVIGARRVRGLGRHQAHEHLERPEDRKREREGPQRENHSQRGPGPSRAAGPAPTNSLGSVAPRAALRPCCEWGSR